MVEGGVREVTLLGQTVNSWFEPIPGVADALDATPPWSERLARTSQFASLLRRIAREVPELARLRYTSPHPRHLTDELIGAHAELDVLARHVHLPVQSGSNRMLKRMLRRYTRELYLERVATLRAAVPGLTLSTDLIVGFPGETEADFEETLDLVREAGFVAAFAFKYSPRPNTPSLKLEDDVPEEVKSARLQAVFDTVAAQQRPHLESLVGSVQEVLVEGISRTDPTRSTGRTKRNEIVHVEGTGLEGALIDVVIERANEHSLMGRRTGAAIPAPPRGPRRLEVLP